MEANNNSKLEALTPEEYYKKTDEFYVAGDINGFLEFQRTHSILYEDPIPSEHKEILKNLQVPDLPNDFQIEPI